MHFLQGASVKAFATLPQLLGMPEAETGLVIYPRLSKNYLIP